MKLKFVPFCSSGGALSTGISFCLTPTKCIINSIMTELCCACSPCTYAAMEEQSATKSQLIFDVITKSHGFYSLPVREAFRSRVNIPFRVCTESGPCLELEAQFLKEAADAGLMHLKGHRSAGSKVTWGWGVM